MQSRANQAALEGTRVARLQQSTASRESLFVSDGSRGRLSEISAPPTASHWNFPVLKDGTKFVWKSRIRTNLEVCIDGSTSSANHLRQNRLMTRN